MLNDLGVLPDSSRYFYEADVFTKENLFYSPRSGIYRCDRQYRFQRDRADIKSCQLIVVDEGCLLMRYMGKEEKLYPGTFFIMRLGEPHLYQANSDIVKMRWAHLEGRGTYNYVHLIENRNGPFLRIKQFPGIDGKFAQLFSFLTAQERKPERDPHRLSILIHQILAHLSQPSTIREGTLEHALEEAKAYIEMHYGERSLTVEGLADRAALNTSYFLRKFRDYHGITPHQYVKELRIRNSREMLDTTSLPIEDIAEKCGFSNASHFIKDFKRCTGMTPLQFRNLWR